MSHYPENAGYREFKGWNADNFGRYQRHWAAYYAKEVNACLRFSGTEVNRGLRLIEIGFGNGSFMGWARDQGHSICGVEIQSTQLDAAKRAGFLVAESLESLEKQTDLQGIDGAIAFDVFEHLRYPQLLEIMSKLRSLLKINGWILSRHPNGDSPFGMINQHGDLTHVTALGSVAVRQLAVASKLDLVRVHSDVAPFTGIHPLRSAINLLCLSVRTVLELPTQILLNAYYPGVIRWYPLTPNLVAIFVRR